jgi:DNA-binding transcriptional LysR family regulator
LTTKGAEMVRAAQSILQIVSDTKASVAGEQMRGTVALGSLRTGANSLVPQALATLSASFPHLNFRLRVGVSEELMSEVVSGQLDAAVVADHVAVPSSLRWTPVLTEPLIVLTPPGTGTVSIDDLIRDMPYIRYRTQVPLARQIDTEIARLGAAPRQIVSVNTMPAVVGCVRAGLGFAIIPQIALHDAESASLDWFPFGAPPIHRRLGLVQRVASRRAEVLAALVAALIQQGLSGDVHD